MHDTDRRTATTAIARTIEDGMRPRVPGARATAPAPGHVVIRTRHRSYEAAEAAAAALCSHYMADDFVRTHGPVTRATVGVHRTVYTAELHVTVYPALVDDAARAYADHRRYAAVRTAVAAGVANGWTATLHTPHDDDAPAVVVLHRDGAEMRMVFRPTATGKLSLYAATSRTGTTLARHRSWADVADRIGNAPVPSWAGLRAACPLVTSDGANGGTVYTPVR